MQNAAVISAEMLTESLHDTAVHSSMDTSADSPQSFCKLDGKKACTQKTWLHHLNFNGGFYTEMLSFNVKYSFLGISLRNINKISHILFLVT